MGARRCHFENPISRANVETGAGHQRHHGRTRSGKEKTADHAARQSGTLGDGGDNDIHIATTYGGLDEYIIDAAVLIGLAHAHCDILGGLRRWPALLFQSRAEFLVEHPARFLVMEPLRHSLDGPSASYAGDRANGLR